MYPEREREREGSTLGHIKYVIRNIPLTDMKIGQGMDGEKQV
jgi:hypothetical protein